MIMKDYIQVCSDLHLENGDIMESDFPDIIKPCADILILAGDIGNPFTLLFDAFVSYCSSHFIHVLFVSGNHEYYGSTISQTDKLLRGIFSKFHNVHYLNNSVFEYRDVLFVGTTLWSRIPNNVDPFDLFSMNDYNKINDFTISVCNSLFFRDLEFIKQQLSGHKKCIVISHHAPSLMCLSPEYRGDSTNCFFYTPLDNLFYHENLIGWIYGHTHHNWRYFDFDYFVYANCYRSKDYTHTPFTPLEKV